MLNRKLHINEEMILLDDGTQVMNRWEDDLMRRKAEWVSYNRGDVLELGFGMGISANYIQSCDVKSHTICEIHPQVISNLNTWSKNKDNVNVLEGDWYDNIDQMTKYDGVLFDTHLDGHYAFFFENLIDMVCKPGAHVTWWNNAPKADVSRGRPLSTKFEIIDVDPTDDAYFKYKKYYFPKYTHL